jgi:hypothetical protein
MEQRYSQQQHPARLVTDGGITFWCREVDFEILSEPWALYALKDGGTVKHRSIVYRINEILEIAADNPDPQHPTKFVPKLNPNGEKALWVNATPMVTWSP